MISLLFALACSHPPASEAVEAEPAEPTVDTVKLSAEALENARLKVEVLAPQPITASAVVPARIALDPRREALVSVVTGGQVERIQVRAGDRVSAGDVLATVVSADLGEALGAELAASARLEVARAKRDRLAGLLTDGVAAKAQLDDAEAELKGASAESAAAGARLRVYGVKAAPIREDGSGEFSARFPVKTPISGEVLSSEAKIGAAVEPGETLFHIGDLQDLWLLLDVYEKDLAGVKPGASVSFTVDAYGPETFAGTVDQVGGWLDPGSRTAEVRVLIPNADHRLKPNMFASARLALAAGDETAGLVVPGDAVQEVEEEDSVFVETEPGTYAVRHVRFVILADGRAELLDGVEAGERVVTEGAFTLKSELAKNELEGDDD